MVVEAPVEDQAIVVKSYRPVQLTWSQLPQVGSPLVIRVLSVKIHFFYFLEMVSISYMLTENTQISDGVK